MVMPETAARVLCKFMRGIIAGRGLQLRQVNGIVPDRGSKLFTVSANPVYNLRLY
jgi:hypothetical protein